MENTRSTAGRGSSQRGRQSQAGRGRGGRGSGTSAPGSRRPAQRRAPLEEEDEPPSPDRLDASFKKLNPKKAPASDDDEGLDPAPDDDEELDDPAPDDDEEGLDDPAPDDDEVLDPLDRKDGVRFLKEVLEFGSACFSNSHVRFVRSKIVFVDRKTSEFKNNKDHLHGKELAYARKKILDEFKTRVKALKPTTAKVSAYDFGTYLTLFHDICTLYILRYGIVALSENVDEIWTFVENELTLWSARSLEPEERHETFSLDSISAWMKVAKKGFHPFRLEITASDAGAGNTDFLFFRLPALPGPHNRSIPAAYVTGQGPVFLFAPVAVALVLGNQVVTVPENFDPNRSIAAAHVTGQGTVFLSVPSAAAVVLGNPVGTVPDNSDHNRSIAAANVTGQGTVVGSAAPSAAAVVLGNQVGAAPDNSDPNRSIAAANVTGQGTVVGSAAPSAAAVVLGNQGGTVSDNMAGPDGSSAGISYAAPSAAVSDKACEVGPGNPADESGVNMVGAAARNDEGSAKAAPAGIDLDSSPSLTDDEEPGGGGGTECDGDSPDFDDEVGKFGTVASTPAAQKDSVVNDASCNVTKAAGNSSGNEFIQEGVPAENVSTGTREAATNGHHVIATTSTKANAVDATPNPGHASACGSESISDDDEREGDRTGLSPTHKRSREEEEEDPQAPSKTHHRRKLAMGGQKEDDPTVVGGTQSPGGGGDSTVGVVESSEASEFDSADGGSAVAGAVDDQIHDGTASSDGDALDTRSALLALLGRLTSTGRSDYSAAVGQSPSWVERLIVPPNASNTVVVCRLLEAVVVELGDDEFAGRIEVVRGLMLDRARSDGTDLTLQEFDMTTALLGLLKVWLLSKTVFDCDHYRRMVSEALSNVPNWLRSPGNESRIEQDLPM